MFRFARALEIKYFQINIRCLKSEDRVVSDIEDRMREIVLLNN